MKFYIDISEEYCVEDDHAHIRCHLNETDEDVLSSIEIMLLKNNKRFEHNHYGESPIVEESIINFYTFPTQRMQRTF